MAGTSSTTRTCVIDRASDALEMTIVQGNAERTDVRAPRKERDGKGRFHTGGIAAVQQSGRVPALKLSKNSSPGIVTVAAELTFGSVSSVLPRRLRFPSGLTSKHRPASR